jgi:hypothetical protein
MQNARYLPISVQLCWTQFSALCSQTTQRRPTGNAPSRNKLMDQRIRTTWPLELRVGELIAEWRDLIEVDCKTAGVVFTWHQAVEHGHSGWRHTNSIQRVMIWYYTPCDVTVTASSCTCVQTTHCSLKCKVSARAFLHVKLKNLREPANGNNHLTVGIPLRNSESPLFQRAPSDFFRIKAIRVRNSGPNHSIHTGLVEMR